MNLEKKRALAARTLGVGKGRIVFNNLRLNEIKEAITKQDIRDLVGSKAIIVKEIRGRLAVQKRMSRRHAGRIKKKVNPRKTIYVQTVRRFRAYIAELKKHEQITQEVYTKLRKELRGFTFKTKPQLKERIAELTKQ